MTSPVSVRPVDSFAAYRAGTRVVRLAWRAAFDHIVPESSLPAAEAPDNALERLRAAYEDAAAHDAAFVARADGGVVGFARVVWDTDRTEPFVPAGDAELRALYVRPERWGEGVGSTLLERAESAAPSAERLRLRTFEENAGGRAFYRARGFDAVGEGSYDIDGESYPTVEFAKRLR